MKKNIILIGTGPMAVAYAKVLFAQEHIFTVIGRGEISANNFEKETGIKPITGGIEKYLTNKPIPENTFVIIATGTEVLMSILLLVLKHGASKVLVEKPAALSIEELLENEENLNPYTENVFVAYNRRFYASVIEAQRLIAEDGGLQSIHFEFTEWAHKIEPLLKAPGVKENWFFANSTHVIDLAFFLAGKPVDWKAYSIPGKLRWHKKSNFVGAGITEKGVLFSYISNWESAGRWGIELLTEKRRIYLKPLESIKIQIKGTIQINEHSFDDNIDKEFKPGLFKELNSYLTSDAKNLVMINEHIKRSKDIYSKILS